MKKKWLMGIVAAAAVAVIVNGYDAGETAKANDLNQGTYGKMTEEMIKDEERNLKEIITKEGTFVRAEKQIGAGSDETVTDVQKINSKTKQIVLEYGVFVKK